ncbi:MAG: sigma-70 family RNA polymerase sigma factor [Patescibacteria group bacterium]
MAHTDETVITLVERAQAGDEDAFGELYSSFVAPIFRYVFVRVRNRHDAEDITQSVFVKAWKALGRYENRGMPFSAWLYRIARNSTIDHYKKKKDIIPDEPEMLEDFAADDSSGPKAYAEHMEHVRLVERALLLLPEAQREIVRLRFIEGKSSKEVARSTGQSEDAVRQMQSRALKVLRVQLKESKLL